MEKVNRQSVAREGVKPEFLIPPKHAGRGHPSLLLFLFVYGLGCPIMVPFFGKWFRLQVVVRSGLRARAYKGTR